MGLRAKAGVMELERVWKRFRLVQHVADMEAGWGRPDEGGMGIFQGDDELGL